MKPVKTLRSGKTRRRARAARSAVSGDGAVKKRFPIVGVGASAGGLEAFTELLHELPVDTGMGFVLVPHLDPGHASVLSQLLTRATAMPVREVANNLRVEPNHVYVIPPNTSMAITNGVLKLQPRPVQSRVRSIDAFFESLARDLRERAIGVVLSGTASDGTLGLEAIKAEDGITFAQDDTAKYDSMPRSAVAAGCVDFVLAPQGIAKQLEQIARHPCLVGDWKLLGAGEEPGPGQAQGLRPSGFARKRPAKALEQELAGLKGEDAGFRKILALLHNGFGVDFSLYKTSTIQRRITRRMVLNRLTSHEAYAQMLRGNARELELLFGDVLINVTAFFRNPEAFVSLKKIVLPRLLSERRSDPLRMWVVGCSTGQEAYSLAIAYNEYAEHRRGLPKLQVFATDLNEASLKKARAGLYPPGVVQDVSPERLRGFFLKEEGGYRIAKHLRDSVIFARHNVLNDPPFSRMDVITCRNLMIYLERDLQRKVIPTFHYALKPNGFLFLGASESVGTFGDFFELAQRKHKIYVKKGVPPPVVHFRAAPRHAIRDKPAPVLRLPARSASLNLELNAQREADRIALNRYAPPGVLVDSRLQVIQFRGDTGAYLKPPTGKPSFDVVSMAREGLALPLRAALQRAKREKKPLRRENLKIRQDGSTRTINLEVVPLINLHERCFLVFFEEPCERPRPQRPESIPGGEAPTRFPAGSNAARSPAVRQRLVQLEREAAETQDLLLSVQDQYEASGEEFQAANEEITSANEELQSINEELETSKEELESTNEELLTVNEEMSHRNADLARLNTDLVNFQSASNLAIILLSRDLIIRRFTAKGQTVFNLMASDVGRSLLTLRIDPNIPDLEQMVASVMDSQSEAEREVQDKSGRWFSLRVRPYRTLDNIVDGAVLVLVDIDALKSNAQEITTARNYAQAVLRGTRDLLVVLETDLRVHSANEAYYQAFRLSPAEVEGRLFHEVGGGHWNIPELRRLLEDVIPKDKSFNDLEIARDFGKLGRRTMLLKGRLLSDPEGRRRRILLGIHDLTEQREAEARMRRSEIRFRRLFEAAKDGVLLVDPKTEKILDVNPFITELLGYSREELQGKRLSDSGLFARPENCQKLFQQLRRTGYLRDEDVSLKTKNEGLRDVELISSAYQEDGDQIIQCNLRDITERKRAEEALRQSELRYRALAENIPQLIWACTPQGQYEYLNQRWADYMGIPVSEQLGKNWVETVHAEDRARVAGCWAAAADHREVFSLECRLRNSIGQYRWFDVRGVPLFDDKGELVKWFGTCTDIDDRKRARKVLEQTVTERTAALRDTVQELEAFSYSISHDLRAPLRAMNSFAQLLRERYSGQLDAQGIDFLQRISTSGERLDMLIQDVLSYTRILRTTAPLTCVDLDRLVREILQSYPDFQAPKTEVEVEGRLPAVLGHHGFLTQCLSNLLQNAVKFVAPGVKPRVRIRAEEPAPESAAAEASLPPQSAAPAGAGWVRFWVEDNGIGIAPEDRDRVFRMFERVHRQNEYEGTGIGLTIVRKAVERMGGRVGFDSKVGEGSRFWVELRKAEAQENNE